MARWVLPAAIAAALAAAAPSGHALAATSARPDVIVKIGRAHVGRPIPPGFIGLSLEYSTVPLYTGPDPRAVNPVLVRLIRNLESGQAPTLRIGGDSTDASWWPVTGMTRPPGVQYSLSPGWIADLRALAQATRARLILGINLKANSPVIGAAEANALIAGLGRRRIEALEIGNEPDLYPGRGRPGDYDFSTFAREFAQIASALPLQVPLVGPATGSRSWLSRISELLVTEPRLLEVTFHSYGLNACIANPSSHHYATVSHLLAPFSLGRLPKIVRAAIASAHRRGLAFRIDELNSVTCGGKAGVSDTFAAALWMLNGLFAMAQAGVDAVNIHVHPSAPANELCTFRQSRRRWLGSVHPLYYGVLLFTRASPPGTHLLRIAAQNSRRIRSWATIGRDRTIRVVLINVSLTHAGVVLVRPPAPAGRATLERLSAPSAYATAGVSIARQSFGRETATGALGGPIQVTLLRPSGRGYVVTLPAASAAMLTIPPTPAR